MTLYNELSTAILIVSGIMIVTQFFDCWSTLRLLTHPSQERNPIARKIMYRFGLRRSIIWIFWGWSALLCMTAAVLIWLLTSEAAEIVPTWLRVTAAVGYVLFGICTGIVQSFVVRTNMTGRFNVVTRGVLRVFRW